MLSFKCRDLGMSCDFHATAGKEDDLMKKIADHAAKSHNIKSIDADMLKKVKAAIKTV